jgi:hypothetical protein
MKGRFDMINTIRILYPGIHSETDGWSALTELQLTWPPIHRDSTVLISASEYRQDGVDNGVPVIDRFIGDAPITINNISPVEGQVNFCINVDFGSPLNIAVDFVVFDPPQFMVDSGPGTVYPLSAAMVSHKALQLVQKNLSKPKLKEFQSLLVGKSKPVAKMKKAAKKKMAARKKKG